MAAQRLRLDDGGLIAEIPHGMAATGETRDTDGCLPFQLV
jgi:hypothetical protein